MKIALIDGSSKNKESNSSQMLKHLQELLPAEYTFQTFHLNKPLLTVEQITQLSNCSVWVFAFGIYVDGIPSHLLSCLRQLETATFNREHIHVYGLINCGLYEGKQTRHAMSMMEIWSQKTGLKWGMGVGFGGSGGLIHMASLPLGKGPKKKLKKVLETCANAISTQSKVANVYTSIGIPRFLNNKMVEISFKQSIKKNGGKVKDLKRRY